MRFRLLDAALKELRGTSRHYRDIRPELGVKFKDAIQSAFDRIETWPLSGARADDNARICRLKRFLYGLIMYHARPKSWLSP